MVSQVTGENAKNADYQGEREEPSKIKAARHFPEKPFCPVSVKNKSNPCNNKVDAYEVQKPFHLILLLFYLREA